MRTQMNTADNQLSQAFTFNASNQQIRVVTINDEPYFVAKDVCDILSLSDVSMAVSRLDDDEKLTQALLVSGQKRQMWCVNESGLYHLIFQSRKPEAKAFRKWVTAEVLPTLRRTGRYEVKPRRWSQRYERPKEFLDLRSEPYEQKMLNGYAVRVVTHEDVEWYSVADILRSMQVGTSAFQTAASLNASNRELARKIHIFGNTHPAWFTTITGLRLIMSGSRYLLSNPKN